MFHQNKQKRLNRETSRSGSNHLFIERASGSIAKETERFVFSFQFLLVFAFGLMILGTFANLEAIDEKQAEIHEIPAVIPVVDPVPYMEKLPQLVEDEKLAPQASDSRASSGKKKPNKTHKISPAKDDEQIAAPMNISVRDVDLHDAQAEPKPSKKTIPGQNKPDVNFEVKKEPEAEEIVAKSANAKVDSFINKDAIQKEEQEIAIDAKEVKQMNLETAKELLNEVKSEWVKQNKETQKLVLEKIDKISEKVNEIEHMQKEEKQRDSAVPKKQDDELAPVTAVNEQNRNNHIENEKKDSDKEKKQSDDKKDTDEKKKQPEEKKYIDEKKKKSDEKSAHIESPKNIPGVAKLPHPDHVNDPIVESILPKTNADQPEADSADRIGRELLSTKIENDMLSKSIKKRRSRSSADDGENDKEIQLKKTVKQVKIKDFHTEFEFAHTSEDQPVPDTNDKKHNYQNPDDRGIEKNANLDVFLEHNSERGEDKNTDFENGNDLRSL